MENDIQIHEGGREEKAAGCLGEFSWFLSGSIMPLVSLQYYREATQRKVGTALLFFFSFTLVLSVLLTANLIISMTGVTGDIRGAFNDGSIPEIIIEDGIAQVEAPSPLVLFEGETGNGNTIVIIDTSGKVREIDRYQYSQGLLLTRSELHVYNEGRYDVLPLFELHTIFETNPIIINADTVTNAWIAFSMGFSVMAFIFIWLWQSIVRLMILALYALILWGIVSLIRPNTKFDLIIITALYAIVPAVYLTFLFSRIGFRFPGLQTFILLPFWIAAMVAALSEATFYVHERPMRLWTAAIGLPMLVVFCIDSVSEFPAPYGSALLWGLAVVTVLTIAGLRLFYRYKDHQMNAPFRG
jgi:hypothetical protein